MLKFPFLFKDKQELNVIVLSHLFVLATHGVGK